jgi:hypothetical protein
MLCEGNSMRSVSRLADCSINTVTKLLVDAGTLCAAFHSEMVKNVKAKRVQVDEIWSFTYAKKKNVTPKITAKVEGAGGRSAEDAVPFMNGLAARLANRVQLTSDGHKAYLVAVEDAFGMEVDFAQLVKIYGAATSEDQRRYSPPECIGAIPTPITGDPDPKHISTSFAERQNLTMRMQHAPVHAPHERVFQEDREPHAHDRDLHGVLLDKAAQDAENDTCNGCWTHRSRLGFTRDRRAHG